MRLSDWSPFSVPVFFFLDCSFSEIFIAGITGHSVNAACIFFTHFLGRTGEYTFFSAGGSDRKLLRIHANSRGTRRMMCINLSLGESGPLWLTTNREADYWTALRNILVAAFVCMYACLIFVCLFVLHCVISFKRCILFFFINTFCIVKHHSSQNR